MFMREGRRLVLTPFGQVLAEKLGQSIDEMQGACEYVRARKTSSWFRSRQRRRWDVLAAAAAFGISEREPNITVWTATRQTGQSPDLSSADIVITRGNRLS